MKAIYHDNEWIDWDATVKLYAHLIQAYTTTGGNNLTTVDEVLGKRLFLCWQINKRGVGVIRPDNWEIGEWISDKNTLKGLSYPMLMGTPYLITDRFMELIEEHTPRIPDHYVNINTLMPHQIMWMTFATSQGVKDSNGVANSFWIRHWTENTNEILGIDLFSYDADDGIYARHGVTQIQVNDTVLFSSLNRIQKWRVTCLILLSQKIVKTETRKASRALRRRMKKLENIDLTDTVRFIDLRAFDEAHKDSSPTGRYFDKWRWTVRGHWRAQWYPSERAHRLKWIPEYEKGPEDAPLKPRAYKAHR
jgi:hypothetical protein